MVRPKGKPVRSKPRPAAIPKAPPPDDPYAPENLIGKCKRCVGTGELYVIYNDGMQRKKRCDLCEGSGLDEDSVTEDVLTALRARINGNITRGVYQPSRSGSNLPMQAPPTPEQLAASQSVPSRRGASFMNGPTGIDEDLFDRVMAELDADEPLDPRECTQCDGEGMMQTRSGYVGCPACRGTGRR